MIRLLQRYFSIAALCSLLLEMAILSGAGFFAFLVRFGPEQGAAIFTPPELAVRVSLFVLTVTLTFYFSGLYDFTDYISLRQLMIRLWKALGIAAISLWAVYYTLPSLFMGRGLFALAVLIAGLLLSAERLLVRWVLTRREFAERVLLVGADEDAISLAKEILARKNLGYHLVGFVTDDPTLQGVRILNPSVIGTTAQTCELALANEVNRVVVAQRDYRGKLDMDALLQCKTSGIRVERGYSYYEKLTGKMALEGLRKSWLVFARGFVVSSHILFWKRVLDIVLASVGLVVASPIMLLSALAIRCDSPGAVLFSQERTGRDGKLFTLWKFRSMRLGAERPGGAVWAQRNDARVTEVGRLLRRARLDELPQLWNVLRGDMSFVGPRPERPVFVQQLIERSELYAQRLVVRPGLTGWAQINGDYAGTFDESLTKLQFDLYYIKNLSVLLDVSIVLSTLRTVVFGRGAR